MSVPDAETVKKMMEAESDERYRYLLKHGHVHAIETESKSIYVELPQIPGILIIYRRPSERQKDFETIKLNGRDLSHIPLLEGEEKVKNIEFQDNMIKKIENLVSLPSLSSINLRGNII